MKFTLFIPAVIWFIISTILLALPATDLPESSFFDLPYFDKFVHFIIFFLLTVLFSYPFTKWVQDKWAVKRWFMNMALYSVVYGILMEFVQKYFVAGRSFDVFDILFDGIGSLAGMLATMQFFSKKIGPDGNRGRNQN